VVTGVEALVRWQHPKLGMLPPNSWIPAICDSPVVNKLGEWVANQAMADHGKMTAAGHDLHLSINIGSRHFISPGFVETLAKATKRHGFDNAKLDIEVTEDALFSSHERAASVINRLHDLGFTVSIDDFGKGYSNIARLARLQIDFLKIDKTIINGAQEDPRIKAVLASTVDMAKSLDCKTVAEGIETLQHAEFVSSMGINMLQGYYFSRALPLDELAEWLDKPRQNSVHSYYKALEAAVA
jgi:EAL domain-containing protein (putative c-di-GMP-specific phosphodiesterase class I)